jgi:hypothetical protein
VSEALEEAPVVKHLFELIQSAAWGAANERVFGKHRSGAQVDWDKYREHHRKIADLVNNGEFADALADAAKQAAWYAANKYSYGEGHEEARRDLRHFRDSMYEAKKLAPTDWPMKEVQDMFLYTALAASSHRFAQQNKDHLLQYADTTDRGDWKDYHVSAIELRKELGDDQRELFEELEGMTVEAAWGAACERMHGKHAEDALVHWRKYQNHASAAQDLYRGAAKWEDIQTMITSAAWGAANERAYGQSNVDARENWRSFESAASRVSGPSEVEL